MRVHHLNCISTCPAGGALMDGFSKGLRGWLTCHCLLLEGPDGLALVDTGLGLRDVHHPRKRLSKLFLALLRPDFREEMTAHHQLQRLGFDPRDVREIVLTHLDFDHAGGLDDFPQARVHLLASERDSAVAQKTVLDRMRYRPQQWGETRGNWTVYRAGEGEPWFGFDAVRSLDGLGDDILLVPLIGHTLGHAGVAVKTGRGWLLQAGDAYFFHAEMDLTRPHCTPGLRLYQWMLEKDRRARLWNQTRLRELKHAHSDEVRLFSAHDVREFEALSGHAFNDPVRPRLVPVPNLSAGAP